MNRSIENSKSTISWSKRRDWHKLCKRRAMDDDEGDDEPSATTYTYTVPTDEWFKIMLQVQTLAN